MSSQPSPVRFRLREVPASHGAAWVRRGFQVFMQKPLLFTVLLLAFFFGVFVLMILPYIGTLLVLAALPLLTLGFMLSTQAVLKGAAPSPGVFVLPLRADAKRRTAMVQLGIAYAVGSLVIMLLADLADGGSFADLQAAMLGGQASEEEIETLLASPQLPFGMALRFGLATLLALPFWHAPALVWWGSQGAPQALFSSTLACWRARNAFVVYGLVWGLVIGGFALLVNIVFALLGSRELVGVAALPAALLFSTVFYVSLYFSFVGCFEADHGNGFGNGPVAQQALPPAPPPDGPAT